MLYSITAKKFYSVSATATEKEIWDSSYRVNQPFSSTNNFKRTVHQNPKEDMDNTRDEKNVQDDVKGILSKLDNIVIQIWRPEVWQKTMQQLGDNNYNRLIWW